MNFVIQQLIDGLSTGAVYASLALALVLVYRSTGMVNFAQGAMGAVGAYIAWTLWTAGVPTLIAVALAMALSVLFGAAVERTVIRRLSGQDHLTVIIVAVGILILLTGITGQIWGHGALTFPAIFPDDVFRMGGIAISAASLGNILVLALIVAAMQLVFHRTRFGLALRGVADNRESSSLLGLPTSQLLMAGWGIAAALATLAACLLAPKVLLNPHLMDAVLVYALTAAVLGGLNSPLGAVLAGLLIGVLENLAAAYVPIIGNDLKIVIPLVLMAVVLVVRPQGLFGTKATVRV